MSKRISLLLVLLSLAACQNQWRPSDAAYYNHGGPEQLLDVSSEVVNLSVGSAHDINALKQWIRQDHPTRAELYCSEADPRCRDSRRILESNGIPVMVVPSGDFTAALVYERVLAHDCDQRYHDDSHDYFSYNHPDFGCSIAANMIQQVSDKQQFVAPNLTDVPPATGAVATYGRAYATPTAARQPYSLQQSVIEQAASAGGGQ